MGVTYADLPDTLKNDEEVLHNRYYGLDDKLYKDASVRIGENHPERGAGGKVEDAETSNGSVGPAYVWQVLAQGRQRPAPK